LYLLSASLGRNVKPRNVNCTFGYAFTTVKPMVADFIDDVQRERSGR
jgi:hypothetical protein